MRARLCEAAREAEALRRELAALQDRVKVLERIATDESRPRALADEIEALRLAIGGETVFLADTVRIGNATIAGDP